MTRQQSQLIIISVQ